MRPVAELPIEKRVRAFGSAGFSLVEVALAVGITSFCLLTLLALLPTGLRSADAASRQSMAVSLGNGILSDLKATAAYAAANSTTTLPNTTRYQLGIPTTAGTDVQYALYLDENGNVIAPGQSQFLAVLTLIPQSTSGTTAAGGLPKPAVLAQLVIIWPAVADASVMTPASPPTQNSYTPGTASTDLRAKLQNYNGVVEMAGTVDLEQ